MNIQITSFQNDHGVTTIIRDSLAGLRTNDQQDTKSPRISDHTDCKRYLFVEWPTGHTHVFDNLDRRHLGVCLSGQVQFQASDGALIVIGAGQTWQFLQGSAQDLKAEVIGDAPFQCLLVQLD